MRTIKFTLIAMLFSITLTAQVKQGLEVETQSGYEYNYFKSPTEVHQNGVIYTEKDLVESSIYQDIMLDYDYRKKWGENRIRFSIAPSSRVFYQNLDDSYWSLLARAKYDYSFTKTTKLLAQMSFKRMNRQGLDGAQDLLINPLGYTNYGVKSGLEFELAENNETTVMAFYNFKNFDEYGVRDLQFNEFGIQFRTQQEFKVNDLKHKYGLVGYIKKRTYDTFNASETTSDGERNWGYIKMNAFYKYPVSKTLEVKPSFVYYVRSDKNDYSGFKQFGPAIALKFDNKKTKIRSGLSYLTRNYASIAAKDNNGPTGEKIQYNYLDITFDAEHQIEENLSITATVYSRVRNTNYTDLDARSFRGYRNQYIGIGVKWEF
ncbi:hypothetical protein L3073_05020 [Ancylomarina sp. DW003]|nr:hypothetical protein [Ancylomarina sp. DW003]MDE5421559.1 hypothetical protein [Ancylomarina sp. DW003]